MSFSMQDGQRVPTDPNWTFPTPSPGTTPRYVPVAVARERLEAAGKWTAVVELLDMPAVLKLATLEHGIDPSDAAVRGVLVAAGVDPDVILAV